MFDSNSTLEESFSNISIQRFSNGLNSLGSPILVVGAASFIGAHIVKHFRESSVSVIATEDSVNIEADPMMWYRWEQLIALGASPQFVNYTDHQVTLTLLQKYSPNTIIFVPTSIFSPKSFEFGTRDFTEQFENYLLLLETVKKWGHTISLVLLSHMNPLSSQESLSKFFETALLSYSHLLDIDAAIVRSSKMFGPWQIVTEESPKHCFIGDLTKRVADVVLGIPKLQPDLVNFNCSEEGKQSGTSLTEQWLSEYEIYKSKQTKDIVVSSYFTTKRNAQYPIEFINNNYYFMENWFKNIYKMDLHMMVLHDDLSQHFTSTFEKNYPKADFVKIKDFYDYRPNDRRFLGYYEYILGHPEIRSILMTDMRDVVIQNNPFEAMKVVGDYAYVGVDRPFKESVSVSDMLFVFRRCFGKDNHVLDYHNEIQLLGFLNAGTIGGSRHVMLAFLTRFLQYFQTSNKDNCNMGIVEILFHKFFFDKLFYGWPINAAFLTEQPNIPGLAVLHKWSMESYN